MNMPRSWQTFEFKTDPKNGCLIGPDDCHYETPKKAYHFAFLGMCGCGCPEEAYNFCRDILMCFDRRDYNAAPVQGTWVDAEAAASAIIQQHPKIAAHVLAHLLTNRDLLEHGGSVGGSWLTKWGEQLVDAGPMKEDELDD